MILILGREGGTAVSFAAVSTIYCLAAPVEFGRALGRFPPYPQPACPLDPRTPLFLVKSQRSLHGGRKRSRILVMRHMRDLFRFRWNPFTPLPLIMWTARRLGAHGATASLACFKWLERHNSLPKKFGIPTAEAYPASARFKIGNGRVAKIRFAADVSVGVAGRSR